MEHAAPRLQLSRTDRLAFLSACAAAVTVHLYVFSNLLLGNDGASSAFTANEHLASGRWALEFFSSFSSVYQMPVVIGAISVVMLALTAVVTVRFLALSTPLCVVLTSALLVSFPSVACTFAYLFTADAYFIALFLAAAAAYLAKRFRRGWAAAVVLTAVSCGIYQAYLSYGAALLLFDCVLALLEGRETLGDVLRRGVRYLAVVICSLLLYYGIESALLAWKGASLTDYMGMDTIGGLHLRERIGAVPKAYETVWTYLRTQPFLSPLFRLARLGAALLCVGAVSCLLWRRRREPARLLTALLGLGLLPLALGSMAVLAYGAFTVHQLMIYAFALVLPFTLKCVELAWPPDGKRRLPRSLCALCCALLLWNDFCVSNIGYHSLQLCYENTFALANRIAARIEVLEGYAQGSGAVAFIGSPARDLGRLYGNSGHYEEFRPAIELMCRDLVLTRDFLRHYTGLHIPDLSEEDRAAVRDSPEAAAMPCYPEAGSVLMVDGVAVVKFGPGRIW